MVCKWVDDCGDEPCYKTARECQCACGELDPESKECRCDNYDACLDPFVLQDDCSCVCPEGTPEACNGGCYEPCPDGKTRNPNTCACDECPAGLEPCNGECYYPCPDGQTRNPDTCACEECPEGLEPCNGECYDPCPDGQVRNPDTCGCECPAGKEPCNGDCYDPCPNSEERDPNSCDCFCPPDKFRNVNNECVDCPPDTHEICDGNCVEKCVAPTTFRGVDCDCYCPPGTVPFNGDCVEPGYNCTETGCQSAPGGAYSSLNECLNACGPCVLPPAPNGRVLLCEDGTQYGSTYFVPNLDACTWEERVLITGSCDG